ncbi:MAG TPA: VWA domain-containing protein [Longimicrobiales bacterium]|nr:VWA domain-containing protein [Longimicrobiales bacterium]
MRFTTYTKYTGLYLDAVNVQDLLERLADFLLQSGFAGGPQYHPWWGETGDDADRSLDALKEALLQALIESGQLTPDMLKELRGEGQSSEDARQKIAELLDQLVQKLMEEGYLSTQSVPQMPDSMEQMGMGPGMVDEAKAAQQVEFNLTQKGIDFLGYRTLRHLLGAMGKASFGSHDTPHLATGIEADAESKAYEFGDTLNLDIPATLKNALKRGGSLSVPLDIDYPDLMVHQAEYRSSCATVLLLDISHSMILYGEDRFTPAKKVALALSHLIRTQYPGDSLRVVTFGDRAQEIPIKELAHTQVGPYHTNTAEGLKVARRVLRAQKKDMRQIVMITDGKPSAITLPNGQVYKNPAGLDPRVIKETLREVAACRKAGILINTFMLARDPALVQFVAKVCEMARGKAYFTNTMTLGQYVMRDFLKRRTRRVR